MTGRASIAQVGGRDQNVIAHQGFRAFPEPEFPLTTERGKKAYEKYGRLLFERGQLTIPRHMALSRYALIQDQVERLTAAGKPLRGAVFKELRSAEHELGIHDIDAPIAAPVSAPTNKFARNGFSARRG